jgi:hypothetical protein
MAIVVNSGTALGRASWNTGTVNAIVCLIGKMLRSENQAMTLSFKWFASLATTLVLASSLGAFCQTAPAPTPPAQRAPAPGTGSVDPSKMTPTGLAANGGSLANDTYTNTTYGFSLKVPPGWVVVPSKNPVAPPVNAREAALMQAAQANHVLLVMTENAPMKKSAQRKSLQIVATRLLKTTAPNEGEQYLIYSKRTALERKMAVEYQGDPTEVTINGNKFWTIGLNQSIEGAVQHVEQYVTTQGSVLLQFMLVSPDEKGLKDLEPSVQSIEMKAVTEKPAAKPSRRKKPAATPANPAPATTSN